QLGVLDPRFAILDELDSGLDVDALRACARRVEAATETGLGVLCITHYTRVLTELRADAVHLLVRGEVRDSGGPQLADPPAEGGQGGAGRGGGGGVGAGDPPRGRGRGPVAGPHRRVRRGHLRRAGAGGRGPLRPRTVRGLSGPSGPVALSR